MNIIVKIRQFRGNLQMAHQTQRHLSKWVFFVSLIAMFMLLAACSAPVTPVTQPDTGPPTRSSTACPRSLHTPTYPGRWAARSRSS